MIGDEYQLHTGTELAEKKYSKQIAMLGCAQLHEVMEQQTVSVAKAGIIATLNARTSVLASANPVGSRYNPRMSIVDNLHLPPSLISRFDLIYLVLDKAEEANDRRLARHLLSLHYPDADAAVQARSLPPFHHNGTSHISLLPFYIFYASTTNGARAGTCPGTPPACSLFPPTLLTRNGAQASGILLLGRSHCYATESGQLWQFPVYSPCKPQLKL